MRHLKARFPLLIVIFTSLLFFAISLRVTMFRYENYEFGKFDLGNMSQMVYNSLHGRFMEVTDYFGTNMPRWGMSHVDPFLLLFTPFYLFFPDARVLVIGQLILVISSAVLIYLIARKTLKSELISVFLALSFLFYPAVGYLLAWTGFHGVTAVIPFFLAAFYVFELMFERKSFRGPLLGLFYLLIVLTALGKEEISLIILMYGVFLILIKKNFKIGSVLVIGGVLWFVFCFMILIPRASTYRIEGFKEFASSVELDIDPERDVLNSNYFISRYNELGSSYGEIIINVIKDPMRTGHIFFSGDKKENFVMTFKPLGFIPFFYLPILIISAPEFFINYLTTSGGIGTSEIYNHRISMIIPILFLSVIYSIKFFEDFFRAFTKLNPRIVGIGLSAFILGMNIYTSNEYQNPIVLWFTQSVARRLVLGGNAFANESPVLEANIGDSIKLDKLETKDRECFDSVIRLIPQDASVSAPDYLGAHLASRRVNALFPALFNKADYVIVDVFSRKVSTILGIDNSIVNTAVGKVVRDPEYTLLYSCSNIFVFGKMGSSDKSVRELPLQEEFVYQEKYAFDLGPSIKVVDFSIPESVEKGKPFELLFVFKKVGSDGLNSNILYTTFENSSTGDLYQIANLPSFGISPLNEWDEDIYYLEKNTFAFPSELLGGKYRVYASTTNNIKTYNVYLGDINLK